MMTTAIEARIPGDGAAATGGRTPKVGPRRRLFAKYAFALVGLVSLVLLVNGLLDVWFSYGEARDAAIRLQREKADAAAQRIGDFIAEIEKQIGWTTATQWASSPIEQRRFDFGRLQRQVPAITELIQLDGRGHEQLKVSRLAMDVVGSGTDYSTDPRFTEALAKKVWFGPVYFRKESEPYMTMAVAQSGRNAGVTVAEVNLKLIWDVITAIKIGKTGYAYVVDGDGRLIAHPDISRVLRNTDLSGLPQVAVARAPAGGGAEPAGIVRNLDGHRVLSASAAIPKLGWLVFVEQPVSEALAPLYTTVLNTGLLLLLGLAVAVLAGLLLARRMTGPIRELDAGAARIGAGALDHRIAVDTGDELEELAQRFNTMAADLQSSYADLEQKVEDRTAELKESLDRQTATAEVLGIISSSPGRLEPVFDAMLASAVRVCGGKTGMLALVEDGGFRGVAAHEVGSEFPATLSRLQRPPAGTGLDLLRTRLQTIQIADCAAEPAYDPVRALNPAFAEVRTGLHVPMLKEDQLLGAIIIYRDQVQTFGDKEIELVESFAKQAVIAIENARLITEIREALDRQTATAEVLGVINSSPGDLTPVFDAMLEKATQLCEAAFGILWICEDGKFHAAALHGAPEAYVQIARIPVEPRENNPLGRMLRGERLIVSVDVSDEEPYRAGDPMRCALVDLAGARSVIQVALVKDDTLLGSLTVYRQEVRPFSDKQIALLQNFAAQAVIAMENARLITETREALEQQTATAEVLGVINSSPGDLAPVFSAILEKAHTLCGAAHGSLQLYDGEKLHAVATHAVSDKFAEVLRQGYRAADSPAGRALIAGDRYIQIGDCTEIDHPVFRSAAALSGIRTVLFVPLRRDDAFLGLISAARLEVRPFTDKQIALLQNFAAQAVIAMENARLITETREALDQQTATAEVLQVINSSPGDLAPVFKEMLEKAARLCEAKYGQLATYSADGFRGVATVGFPMESAHALSRLRRPPPQTVLGRLERTKQTVQMADITQEPSFTEVFRINPWLRLVRTSLAVPLLREGELVGSIHVFREEVRPFTDKQIALLENFAAQAVIAMENARLLGELRGRTRDLQESLEYQTATSDVLKVISQSGADLEPMLQTLVETAARICNADKAVLQQLRDGLFRMGASFGLSQEFKDYRALNPITPSRGTPIGRMALERTVVHVEDALNDPEFTDFESRNLGEFRTMLAVPLLREGAVIGGLFLARSRVEHFTEKQIALVTTFADQAVIAIENARLFNELRARTSELGRSVDELKMLNEVGQAVSSTLDLRSVLSTILTRSVGLTGADAGAIFRYSRADRSFRLAEAVGLEASLLRSIGDMRVAEDESGMGEAAARRTPLQLPDLARRSSYPMRDVTLAAGFHSALIVPLVGPERILGALTLMRRAAGEFPAETMQLMQTLASQSVLAIQNARLFREIADKSEQLALASQHKSQFLANMSHELRTPLNAILGYAELLVDGIYGALPDRPKGVLERIQNNGKHLLALINDVLDLAKIEAGQLTLTLEDYALPEVVRSVVTATEPLATSKGLKFEAQVQDGMPMGHGDARRVSQVLLNLVGNAIKFTEAGEVEISASSGNGQFVLSVRDTGLGIADTDQERIFGEFQQIDNTNTRNKGGTGLGLAISKRMVEMQGGTISVESVLGQGSTFRVVLPVHVDEMMEAAE